MAGVNRNILLPQFYNDKIISLAYITSAAFFLVSLILVIFNFSQLPPEIPIFYSKNLQILGNKNFIWIMPGIIFLNSLLNFLLNKIFFNKISFLAKVIGATSAVVSFLILWAQFQIILLF